MARIKVCGECWKPVAECLCDEDPPGLVSLSPAPPAGYDGPVRDADGTEDETA
jgi:hypothetical protein